VVASTVASSRNPTLYSTSGEPDSTGSPDHVLVSNTTNWFSTRSSTTTDTAIDVPDGLTARSQPIPGRAIERSGVSAPGAYTDNVPNEITMRLPSGR